MLKSFDNECRNWVQEGMLKRGVIMHKYATPVRVEKTETGSRWVGRMAGWLAGRVTGWLAGRLRGFCYLPCLAAWLDGIADWGLALASGAVRC